MDNNNTCDYIIVGAGIAGLYAAHLLRKQHGPDTRLLIVERDDEVGGRANNEKFHGVSLATGAGIGRWKRPDDSSSFDLPKVVSPLRVEDLQNDDLLKALLREFHFPLHTFPLSIEYGPGVDPLPPNIFAHLKEQWVPNERRKQMSFRDYATGILGAEAYERFVIQSGYSDYEEAEAEDVLFRYGMEDNLCVHGCVGFSVPWRDLVNRMADRIGRDCFQMGATVRSIDIDTLSIMYTVGRKRHVAHALHQIIVATAVDSLRHLFPHCPIYQQIEGQPFLRVYAKFTAKSARLVQHKVGASGHLVVDSPLQKIITMDANRGVYMIAYSDNRSARRLRRYKENKTVLAKLVEDALDIPRGSLEIMDVRAFYWDIGTHYNVPTTTTTRNKEREDFAEEAQHPAPHVVVVGEAVSLHQGWVEGALESVVRIL